MRSDLDAAWKEVGYELEMLMASADRLQGGRLIQTDTNAYIESFLVHYRNLLDFLQPRGSASDNDIKASDFVSGFRSTKTPTKYRAPIDKRLAHLSYSRLDVTPGEKPWDIAEMLAELKEAWDEFTALLPKP